MNGENLNNQNQVNNNLQSSNVLGNVQPIEPTLQEGIGLGGVNNTYQQQAPTPMPNYPQEQNTVVNPMPNVEPTAPSPVATPVSEPVAVPIPGTEGTPGVNSLMGQTVGAATPLMGQDNVNTNAFVAGQKSENIGMMPPQQTSNKKEKKAINKVLFILLIIVLIAIIAFGVYYFLNLSNNKVQLTTKSVTVGVGEVLSDNINDYVTVTKGDVNKCNLNIRNVNINELGEYEYIVTCNKDVFKGKVIVSDITAPEAKINTLFKTVNDEVKVEDFVESCNDPSECKVTFKNEETVKENLKNAAATPYNVELVATDNFGNTKDYKAELYVLPYKIVAFTTCSSPIENMSNFQATKVVSDILPIGNVGEEGLQYLGVSKRKYKYVFTSENEYKEIVGNKEEELTFDNVTGKAYYDDEKLTLTIVIDLAKETLEKENNGTFPVNYADFISIYSTKGYSYSNNTTYTNY